MSEIQILPEKTKLILLRMREEEKFVIFFIKIRPPSISESEDFSFILYIVIIFFILPFFP